MVTFKANSCFIYLLVSCYFWIDFAITIYQECKCNMLNIYYDEDTIDAQKIIINFWIGYKVLNIFPTMFLSSCISTILTYRAIFSLKNSIKLNQTLFQRIEDDSEVVYSNSDILYVFDLFHNPKMIKNRSGSNNIIQIFTKVFSKITKQSEDFWKLPDQCEKEELNKLNKKQNLKEFFQNYIYNWNDTFLFTSRFVNMHIVAFMALYHVCCLIFYGLMYLIFNFNYLQYANFLPSYLLPSLKSALLVPFFLALFICIIQVLLGIRDTKKHLFELYKGTCTYLPPSITLSNSSILSDSFNFGGYLTGYLIWGFLIQFAILVIIAICILILRVFVNQYVWTIIKFFFPIICTLLVKQISNFLTSEVIFLKKGTKILAIDNFRALNVFLYFNFFFDCLIGALDALKRVLITIVASIIMMPRISYSFMGRHLEKFDNGNKLKINSLL